MIWALLLSALMQDVFAADAGPAIVVTAPGKPFRMALRDIQRGQQAFAKDRGRFAPQSALHLRIRGSQSALDHLRLSLTNGRESLSVPIAANGDITLPVVGRGDWSLIGNSSRSAISFAALVLSPGSEVGDRRLGDMRLECRVGWAIQRGEASLIVRGIFDAAGGCESHRFSFYDGDYRLITSATMEERGKTMPLPIAFAGKRYRMLLTDEAYSDKARIHVTYR